MAVLVAEDDMPVYTFCKYLCNTCVRVRIYANERGCWVTTHFGVDFSGITMEIEGEEEA